MRFLSLCVFLQYADPIGRALGLSADGSVAGLVNNGHGLVALATSLLLCADDASSFSENDIFARLRQKELLPGVSDLRAMEALVAAHPALAALFSSDPAAAAPASTMYDLCALTGALAVARLFAWQQLNTHADPTLTLPAFDGRHFTTCVFFISASGY